ncbi:MAG: hypothetical protein JJU29_14720 [Verrucomicrobia bacterium]|nr:hypothetical protein [Verrucomicrobiota bacterium]MCH8513231.1 hypothetical protein [Kiritimatiellia bacterium]
MKSLCFLLMFVTFAGVNGSEIRMLNGDKLQGEILRIEQGRLLISPSWKEGVMEIPAKYVGDIRYAGVQSDWRQEVYDTKVVLGNLDYFEANFLEMNGDHARFQMPWGQTATLKRRHLAEIHFQPPNLSPIFLDVGDLSKWDIPVLQNINQHPVELRGNAYVLRARASLSRELPPLPEKFIFEFTVEPPPSVSNYHVGLSRQNVNEAPFLNMIFTPRQFHFQARQQGGRGVFADNWQVQMPEDGGEIRVRLRVDAGKSEFQLELNDFLVRSWQIEDMDLKPFLRDGMIRVSYQHGNHPLTLKGFRLLEWTGDFDFGDPPGEVPRKADKDILYLQNGDVLSGTVLSINQNHVDLQLGELVIPVDRKRLRSLFFAAEKVSPRRKRARDVEIQDSTGFTRLTLALRQLDEAVLRGESDAWVDVLQIPVQDLGTIRFNPYLRYRNEPSDLLRELGY